MASHISAHPAFVVEVTHLVPLKYMYSMKSSTFPSRDGHYLSVPCTSCTHSHSPNISHQIGGLKSSTPVQSILAALTDGDSEEGGSDKIVVKTLRVDRSAIVKFKKANDVRLHTLFT